MAKIGKMGGFGMGVEGAFVERYFGVVLGENRWLRGFFVYTFGSGGFFCRLRLCLCLFGRVKESEVMNVHIRCVVFLAALVMGVAPAAAQSGGPYEIVSYTIDGGGAMGATGGVFEMSGTIGQPDAGAPMVGGAFELTGGFWPTVGGSSCLADFTGDGLLDIADVFAFLSAYNALDPAADLVVDGVIDILDVFAFLGSYNAGCP